MQHRLEWYWWLTIAVIIALCIYAQSNMFLDWDVAWHLITTQRFLSGGNYVTSFLDINPPILMYTLIPAVLFSKLSTVSIIFTVRVYLIFLSLVTTLTCIFLTRGMFDDDYRLMRGIIVSIAAIIFFLLPSFTLGQREYFVLLGFIPYFLLLFRRVQQLNTSKGICIWTGFLMGVAICSNIEFIVALLACELYLMIKHHNWRSWWRTEIGIILLVLAAYIASIYQFTPNYIHIMLPLVRELYITNFNTNFARVFTNVAFYTWIFAFILYFVTPRNVATRPLQTICLICITLFFIQFALTRKIWYYHILPTLAVGSLLFTLYIMEIIMQSIQTRRRKEVIGVGPLLKGIVAYACLMLLPFNFAYSVTRSAMAYYKLPTSPLNQMLALLKKTKPNSPIYVFSTTVAPGSLLAIHGNVKLGSRTAGLWMLPAAVNSTNPKAKAFLFKSVISDLQRYRPNLIFVNTMKSKMYIDNPNFDYINYFVKNQRFAKIWSQYTKLTSIGNYNVYKLKNPNITI